MDRLLEYTLRVETAHNALEGVWEGEFWIAQLSWFPAIYEGIPSGWVEVGIYATERDNVTIRVKVIVSETVPEKYLFDSNFPKSTLDDFVDNELAL
jgi:hypothetical protein